MRSLRVTAYPNNEIRVSQWRDRAQVPPDFLRQEEEPPPSLDITFKKETPSPERFLPFEPKSPSPPSPARNKVVRFSRRAKNMIIRSGAAMEEVVPPERTLMITCTLPGSTKESFEAIAAHSAYLVHRFRAWLNKRCPSPLSIWVWEWQGRGALHLHLCLACESDEARDSVMSGAKAEWARLLDRVSLDSGVDLWRKNSAYTHASNKDVLQVDVQVVRKSVGAYLSKYLSKSKDSPGFNPARFFSPSRWYGISRSLHDLRESLTSTFELLESSSTKVFALYEDLKSVLGTYNLYGYDVEIKSWDADSHVSYFASPEFTSIKELIACMVPMKVTSSESTRSELTQLILDGIPLAHSLPKWKQRLQTSAPQYVKSFLNAPSLLKSASLLDLEFTLDTLTWSLRYELSLGLAGGSTVARWLTKALSRLEFLQKRTVPDSESQVGTYETHFETCDRVQVEQSSLFD
jgi:hypothetical protein